MPTDFLDPLANGVVLLTTYWLHSGLALVLVWLVMRTGRIKSLALTEWLWKSAAVIALVTVPVQWAGGFSQFVFDLSTGPVKASAVVAANTDGAIKSSTPLSVFPPVSASTEPSLDAVANDIGDSTNHAAMDVPVDSIAAGVPTTKSEISVVDSEETVATISSTRQLETDELLSEESTSPLLLPPVTPVSPHRNVNQTTVSWTVGILGITAGLMLLTGVLRLICQSMLFRRFLAKTSVVEQGPLRGELNCLLREAGVHRQVTLLLSPRDSEPVAFGLFHWRIVLPAGIERTLPHDNLRALLAHELAHLVRGDTVWLWVGRLLCACCAFQPLNFLARRCWQQAAEFQCDDWAVRHGATRLALARCLTVVAERRIVRPLAVPALPAGGAGSTLSKRVERLVRNDQQTDPWADGWRKRSKFLLGVISVAVIICCGPRAELTARTSPTTAANTSNEHVEDDATATILESTDLPDEFELLQTELNQLQQQMRKIDRLLTYTTDPEIVQLTQSLRARTDLFRRRRETLITLWANAAQEEREQEVAEP